MNYGFTMMAAASMAPSPGSGFADLVLSHGPAGYWRLDELSGTVAHDISGNGRHGTYVGSPAFGQSPIFAGSARSTYLSASDWVTLPNSALVAGSSPRTVGIMVRPEDFTGTESSFFITWGQSNNGRGYSLSVGWGGEGTLDLNMHGVGYIITSSVAAVSTEDPFLIGASSDGSSHQLFCNGVMVASDSTPTINTVAASGAIGRRTYSSALPVAGDFSDAFIFPKVLTPSDWADLWSARNGSFVPPPPSVQSMWVGAQG